MGKQAKFYESYIYFEWIENLFGEFSILFSTSVELESDNVFLSVCPKTLGRLQKLSDLAEICSLGEYLGVFFFIFQKFWFLGPGDKFFTNATIGPPNSWKNTEVEPSALRTFDYDSLLIFNIFNT